MAAKSEAPSSADLPGLLEDSAAVVGDIVTRARNRIAGLVMRDGEISADALEREQHGLHALAWLATVSETLRQLARYASRMGEVGKLGEIEQLAIRTAAHEYLNQVAGGIPMNQAEFARPTDMGLARADLERLLHGAPALLLDASGMPAVRARLVELMIAAKGAATFGDPGFDPTLEEMRLMMRRFVEAEVAPNAHGWHLSNAYVPLDLIGALAELGVFSLTLPDEWGGMGLGKESMCIVSEELSRGWIAVGSLGTRAEIASELILQGGTEEQKRRWLPGIAHDARRQGR
jgi:(2S)-methylsuccinyl-CoA dehydrogenase